MAGCLAEMLGSQWRGSFEAKRNQTTRVKSAYNERKARGTQRRTVRLWASREAPAALFVSVSRRPTSGHTHKTNMTGKREKE